MKETVCIYGKRPFWVKIIRGAMTTALTSACHLRPSLLQASTSNCHQLTGVSRWPHRLHNSPRDLYTVLLRLYCQHHLTLIHQDNLSYGRRHALELTRKQADPRCSVKMRDSCIATSAPSLTSGAVTQHWFCLFTSVL